MRRAAVSLFVVLSGCTVAVGPAPSQPPPPPPGPPNTIRIVAGSYGQNCRAAHGNVTPHLQQACDGQQNCAYRIDHRVIGDPAFGCQKDYVAEWTCGGDPNVYRAVAAPEAGYGSVVQLICAGGVAIAAVAPPPPPRSAAPPPPPPPPPPPRRRAQIHIVAGTYGQNCRAAYGNKTPHLQQSCEGHTRCVYRVDYKVIGDPAYGCAKDYIAEWRCGDEPGVRRAVAAPEAGYGKTVELACE